MGKQGFSRLAEAAFAAGALAADRAEPFSVLEVDTAVLAFHIMRPLSGIFIISNSAAQCKIFRRRAANTSLFPSAEGKRFRRYSGAPLEARFTLKVSVDIGRLRRPGVPVFTGENAAVWRRHSPRPSAEGKIFFIFPLDRFVLLYYYHSTT